MKDKTKVEYWQAIGHGFELASEYAELHVMQFSREECFNRGKALAAVKYQEEKAKMIMPYAQEIKDLHDSIDSLCSTNVELKKVIVIKENQNLMLTEDKKRIRDAWNRDQRRDSNKLYKANKLVKAFKKVLKNLNK